MVQLDRIKRMVDQFVISIHNVPGGGENPAPYRASHQSIFRKMLESWFHRGSKFVAINLTSGSLSSFSVSPNIYVSKM